MSEYKGIKGFQVQTRTEDPVPYAQALADNPYAGSWSSGGTVNTGRNTLSAAGTLTANLIFGGEATNNVANTERYDGTSWTEVNDLNTALRGTAGAGAYDSALRINGYDPSASPVVVNAVESWNGTSWTEIAEINTARMSGAASGASNTSSLIFGGASGTPNPANIVANTETWNGSAWTEVNDLNAATYFHAGTGTQTSALAMSGYAPGKSTKTESWNGSTWTEVNDLNVARAAAAASGSDNTNALFFAGDGGGSPSQALTESWDGSSWTEVADLSTAKYRLAGSPSGSSTSALASTGFNVSDANQTTSEEWTFSGLDPSTTPAADYSNAITGDFYCNSTTGQFKAIKDGGAPIGSWSSGGNLNTAKYGAAGSGDASNAIVAGGSTSPYVATTEQYDGSSWTEVNDLNQARGFFGGTNSSPYTDSLVFGGASPPAQADTEEWDGTSWTEVADLNTARIYNGGFGANAENALCCGGNNPGATDKVESWNGSSWTEVAEFSTTRSESPVGAGTNTAGLLYGGQYPPGLNVTANTESWNGSAWTEVSDLNTARGYMGGGGSQTVALAYGGRNSSTAFANTESWNGSSWSEVNDLGTARHQGTGASTTTNSSALYSGGYTTTILATTEEWTAADFQIKSVTTS